MSKTVIVIGGGAAGFFCAVNLARLNRNLKVIILEKTGKVLSKVKVSGGGRCNVTHACFDIGEMTARYPRGSQFVKRMFHSFFTTDTIRWFEERQVQLKTEPDGRMFPTTDSSQTIIDCLLAEASAYGVSLQLNTEVKKITKHNHGFNLETAKGQALTADFVCIACGGYPKAAMFQWLTELGHSIEEPLPSLFTFNLPGHPITALMGVSVPHVRIKIKGSALVEEGPVLITHWGLSGPAVLRLSAWGARELAAAAYRFTVFINWTPGMNEQDAKIQITTNRSDKASQKITGRNDFGLAQRLWEFLVYQSGITENMRWADLPAALQNKLIRNLTACEFSVEGKTTFKEEFVTAGGIKRSEVDPITMQSRLVPGLFFAGEIIDVDGITGGFNFQHAWSSGFIAARSMASYA